MNSPSIRFLFWINFHRVVSSLLVGGILGAATAVMASEREPSAIASPPPNIVILLADDLGFSDLGCYGAEIRTPHLDRLAKGGLRFTHFYNTARCWPTRGALLTGYYAQQIRRDQVDGIASGGQGKRPVWATLLPAHLRSLGYRSYHSGKWHIDGLPLREGFDGSYRLDDHDRHFRPRMHYWNDSPLPAVPEGEPYYSTNEIANRTLAQWEQHATDHPESPFFSYVAFTAPHFPLQAPKDAVDRCVERYREGWDRVREQRWQRMSVLGLGSVLSPVEPDVGPPYDFPEAFRKLGSGEVNRPTAWRDLNPVQQEFQIRKMAVHAAMVECMDQEIGRLLAWLEEHQRLNNTLILFLSDNGASAEVMVRGDGHMEDAAAGAQESFLCLGPGWSTVCNTPFRKHKTWVHEGGICTPCILHWPQAITAQAAPIASPLHVIDVLPTLLEAAAGSPFSGISHGTRTSPQPPFPGISFLGSLNPQSAPWNTLPSHSSQIAERVLWWQHERNRAIRQGDWKLVAAGRESEWELYNLQEDRTESRNLASDFPERVERLADVWENMRDAHRTVALQPDP